MEETVKKITTPKNSGQVALLVLLISAIVMTVGLSVSKKTTVDIKVERSQEQLKQAFNTAESGIEYYLATGSTKFTAVDNNSTADITTKNIGGGTTINFNDYVLPNQSVNYWLVDHTAAGDIGTGYYAGTNLSLCVSSAMAGALKIDYYSLSGTNYLVSRYGYNITAGKVSGFTNVTLVQGNCSSGYRELTIPLSGSPLLLAVRVIGSSGRMYIWGNANFPVQGIFINSLGKVVDVSTGTNTNTNVETKRYYQVPSFMTDAITAFGSVLSN